MDRKYFYYGRLVTTSDQENLQDAIEGGDLRIVRRLLDWGMLSGGVLTASTPADWNMSLSVGYGFDDLGQWVEWEAIQTIDGSVDYLGNTTVPAFGYQRNAIYAYFLRGEDDIQMDHAGNPVYYGRPESFEIRVIKGDASPTIIGATTPADPVGNGIYLGYFWTRDTSVSIQTSDISQVGKDLAVTLPAVNTAVVNHIALDSVDDSVHGILQGAGNAFDADTVDTLHAADFALVGHTHTGGSLHINWGHGGGTNADMVDGFHASELRGNGGGTNITNVTNITIIDINDVSSVVPGDPVVVVELVRCVEIDQPPADGPVPNNDVAPIFLTVFMTATAIGGATSIVGSVTICSISGTVMDEVAFVFSGLSGGKEALWVSDIVLDPNVYEKNTPYRFQLKAACDDGQVTIDDWVVSQRTRRGSGENYGEWRSVWQETFKASCSTTMANALEFELGFITTGTTDPMVGAKLRVRTFPTGGVPEAGVHIETSDEQALESIAAGSTYRVGHNFPLTTSGYTATDRYWFVVQVYIPEGQTGSLEVSSGRFNLIESAVAIV